MLEIIMDEYEMDIIVAIYSALTYTCYTVTILGFIYGVTSWCVLKKFRNYKNYICLNLLLVQFLNVLEDFLSIFIRTYIIVFKEDLNGEFIIDITGRYLMLVRGHWLVVMSHMFYVEFVQVLNAHIQRRYFKSCLFGWGLPVLTAVIDTIASLYEQWYVGFAVILLPFIINTFLYIIIVCSLCRSSVASTPGDNKCRRLYIATLIFILSDVSILAAVLIRYIVPLSEFLFITQIIAAIMFYLQPILLPFFFVLLRSNRELWSEFYVTKLRARLQARSLYHDREPADSRPQNFLDTHV